MGSAMLKVKVRVGNVETTWAEVRRPRLAEVGSTFSTGAPGWGRNCSSDSTPHPWDHSLLAGAHQFGSLMQWAPVNI